MCKVLGSQEYQLIIVNSLPTIVVAGNQSSGKSSLIEAISGVSPASLWVPRTKLTGMPR